MLLPISPRGPGKGPGNTRDEGEEQLTRSRQPRGQALQGHCAVLQDDQVHGAGFNVGRHCNTAHAVSSSAWPQPHRAAARAWPGSQGHSACIESWEQPELIPCSGRGSHHHTVPLLLPKSAIAELFPAVTRYLSFQRRELHSLPGFSTNTLQHHILKC